MVDRGYPDARGYTSSTDDDKLVFSQELSLLGGGLAEGGIGRAGLNAYPVSRHFLQEGGEEKDEEEKGK